MKLFTKAQKEKLIKNHMETQDSDESIKHKVVVKLFNPSGIGTWYLTELNPDTNIAFGLADLHEKELGYIDISELENLKLPMGLKIERDLHYETNIRGVIIMAVLIVGGLLALVIFGYSILGLIFKWEN